MALPASGTIWMSQIRDEFGNWGPPNYLTHYYRGALTTANNVGVPTGGAIYFSQFHGAKRVVPGSQTWSAVGSQGFIIPPHTSITITVNGAGGGGGGWFVSGSAGGTGALTRVSGSGVDVRGNGGVGGYGGGGGGGQANHGGFGGGGGQIGGIGGFGGGGGCILGGWLLWRDLPQHLNDNFPAWLEKTA